MRTPEGAPPSTSSALPEPSVLPPRTPSFPRSCDLAPHRLASYRLDALSTPIGYPTGTLFFSDVVLPPPSHRSDCPTSPTSDGTPPLDVAAEDRNPPIRLPRSLKLPQSNLEPWSCSNRGRFRPTTMPSTHDGDRVLRTPKGLPHGGRCGSATEMFGAKVDARRHDDVATVTTRPACITAQRWNPRPFDPDPTRLLGLTETELCDTRWPRRTATPIAPQSQTRQTVRPPSTDRDDDRSPPPSRHATRRRARTTEYRLCTWPPGCPKDSMRGPNPRAAPPGKPDGRSRERPQRQLTLIDRDRKTNRNRPRATGHVDVTTVA
jgi:hypothetical protein